MPGQGSHSRPGPPGPRPARSRTAGRVAVALVTSLVAILAAQAVARAEGADAQPLKPSLLAPARAPADRAEEHRAQSYRFGLTRSLHSLESKLQGLAGRAGPQSKMHGRLGVQSRINATRREHTRVSRGLSQAR